MEKSPRFYKTRIAPTPSGFLHLGNALSFAITAALAQQHGTKILLRIDDLDRQRVNPHYVQDVFDTLDFLSLPWHEGPRSVADFEANYSQRHRMFLYLEALEHLRQSGSVFACDCSRTTYQPGSCCCLSRKIDLDEQNVNWRLIANTQAYIKVQTDTGQTISTTLPPEMQNFVVKKKDGFPAYQLSSVIDDLYFGVDLIVRGLDLWPSTLAQLVLAEALGRADFGSIAFRHHPLMEEAPGKKLSKSAGSTSIQYLRQSGKTSTDVFRLIAGMMGIQHPVSNWQELAEALSIL